LFQTITMQEMKQIFINNENFFLLEKENEVLTQSQLIFREIRFILVGMN
jgi:hypothetical protein